MKSPMSLSFTSLGVRSHFLVNSCAFQVCYLPMKQSSAQSATGADMYTRGDMHLACAVRGCPQPCLITTTIPSPSRVSHSLLPASSSVPAE